MVEADPTYWLRRSRELLDARPKPRDRTGDVPLLEVAARSQRLTAAAQACRARAQLAAEDRAAAVAAIRLAARRLLDALDAEVVDAVDSLRAAIERGAAPDLLARQLADLGTLTERRNVAAARRNALSPYDAGPVHADLSQGFDVLATTLAGGDAA